MTDKQSRPPRWFVVVGYVGLAWNLLGVAAFLMQMTMDLSDLPQVQRQFHEQTPLWATIAFFCAVVGGSLGCLALVMRKRWALPMLLICLLGIVAQSFHSIVVGNGLEAFGKQGLVLPIATFVIALFLTWVAWYGDKCGWLDPAS